MRLVKVSTLDEALDGREGLGQGPRREADEVHPSDDPATGQPTDQPDERGRGPRRRRPRGRAARRRRRLGPARAAVRARRDRRPARSASRSSPSCSAWTPATPTRACHPGRAGVRRRRASRSCCRASSGRPRWPAAPPSSSARAAARRRRPVPDDPTAAAEYAAAHPDRQEARIVAGVLRTGESCCALRQRAHDEDDSVVLGADLVPALLELLHATFDPDAGDPDR